ncbi:DNA methylase [Thermomonospora echinospora]|uniref:Methyltransferase n=1 Tax=Thermomonospora echinospora TaxID=1992 RepID=A0A1H5YUM1_9ACTN|nr:DNA methyltransferase [Thermomonospora echinospora]SEG26966.1 DNA methylase [Thermomonospora echinospora]
MTANDQTTGHRDETLASVLVTGQQPSRLQRRGRYLAESMRHPGKMLPAIAAQVISAYTRPGDHVLDPMCGIGTTLVEAIHLGRNAAGMEYERDFARMAADNVRHAQGQGATGAAEVVCGDAHTVTTTLSGLCGRVALVLTSPPYGSHTHGHVRSGRDNGGGKLLKQDHRYSHDRGNLAHQGIDDLLHGVGRILGGSAELLRPGGVLAVTVRPIRVKGELVDLPGRVIETAGRAGLVLTDRFAALLCGLRDGGLVTRASFFQMLETHRVRERGMPACVTAHEDLLIFQRARDVSGGGR